MTKEEIDTITDLLFGNGYDMLKTINDLNNKVKEKNKEIERLNNKLNAIRKYLKDNEQEYGSLEDNEKIILSILNGDSNE